jgi:hypothetical protein
MYACNRETGRGYFEGVCDTEDWYALLKTYPTTIAGCLMVAK